MSRQLLQKSQTAATAVNTTGAVVAMLEGGTVRGWEKTASKIIALCKKEQIRQLKLMDAADAKLGYPYPGRAASNTGGKP